MPIGPPVRTSTLGCGPPCRSSSRIRASSGASSSRIRSYAGCATSSFHTSRERSSSSAPRSRRLGRCGPLRCAWPFARAAVDRVPFGAAAGLGQLAERLAGGEQGPVQRHPRGHRPGELREHRGRLGGVAGERRRLARVGDRAGHPAAGPGRRPHPPLGRVPRRRTRRPGPGRAGPRRPGRTRRAAGAREGPVGPARPGGTGGSCSISGTSSQSSGSRSSCSVMSPHPTPNIHRCRKPPPSPMIAPWA